MGGKSGGSAPAPPAAAPNTNQQYIAGSFDPTTGQPMLNPNYQAPMEFAMPDFSGMAASNAASQADYAAQLAEQQAKAERTAGENDRDGLFSDYMSAAESSTDYINNQIKQTQANAALTGTKYSVDDEQKGTMISDYFASVWGAGDQSRLEGLMDKWGNPEGFEGFSVTRGDGSAYADGGESSEDSVSASKGRKPTLAGGEEEESLGAKLSILGG